MICDLIQNILPSSSSSYSQFFFLVLVCCSCDDPVLRQIVWGKAFSNPVGLAAGFDKNARAIDGLLDCGFGFVEVILFFCKKIPPLDIIHMHSL
jgi:hypothetical protein